MRKLSVFYPLMCLLLAGCNGQPSEIAANDHSITDDPHAGISSEAAPESEDGSGLIELGEITLSAPAGWTQLPPSSSFVVAEFSLPRAEGDDADGRLTVSTAGGTVEANIERWKGQFDTNLQQESQTAVDVAGISVTIVDLSGDFKDQRGPLAPAVERPGYRMVAAILPVDNRLHFVKATGPEKTIAAHTDEIHEFIRTVDRKQ